MASAKRNGTSPPRGAGDGESGRGLHKERAYGEIKQRILSGEYPPGSFLSERQVALQLAMSKTPIRAALERLELEGFVIISPQQGVILRDLSIDDIADHYEFRAALESFVLRKLAGRLTPAQEERLAANLADQEANARERDVERGVRLDADFHTLFCEFLGNQEILRVVGHLRDKIHRLITRVYKLNAERIVTSYEEHRGIAEAVLQGDAALAAQRIEAHLEYGKQALLSPRRA
jgi:DNA-binding GntR family transcriptional regulator